MTIEYYTRRDYGTYRHFVVDQEKANLICKLTGKLTLHDDHMRILAKFGVNFKQVPDPKAVAE